MRWLQCHSALAPALLAVSWFVSGVAAQAGYPSSTSSPAATATACAVTLEVYKSTIYGESISVAGSIPQLGTWSQSSAIVMNGANYPPTNNEWFATIYVAAGTSFEYKYISSYNGTSTWEPDPNRCVLLLLTFVNDPGVTLPRALEPTPSQPTARQALRSTTFDLCVQ